MNGEGMAIIQQRHDPISKKSWWGEIDKCLADDIYLHSGFMSLFRKYANQSTDGLYPTITVRQAMWYLKMKPLKREPWETVFDKSPI